MAKKGKPSSKSSPLEAIGRFFQFVLRRCKRYPTGPGRGANSEDGESRQFSSPVRFVFIVVALPVLIMFFFLMTYSLLAEGNLQHLKQAQDPMSRFKYLMIEYQTFVVFISASVVSIQLMAIFGALFNWPTVLFAYVVITGLLGTVVGVIGICGIVISCLLMSHKSESDHSILITTAMVIAFIFLFYLLTILGLKLMSYMRRRMAHNNGSPYYDGEYGGRAHKRVYKSSPVARRGHKRSSYKSIDAITSPFNQINDEQELSHVYIDSQGASLKTLLPQSPSTPPATGSSSSSIPRNAFTFQI